MDAARVNAKLVAFRARMEGHPLPRFSPKGVRHYAGLTSCDRCGGPIVGHPLSLCGSCAKPLPPAA